MCEENKEIEGKNCSKCGKWKEIEQYRLTTKRNKPYRRAECKSCSCKSTANFTKKNKIKNENLIIPENYHKTCTNCSKNKHWTEFPKNLGVKDGLYSQCRSCVSVKTKNRKQQIKEINKKLTIEELFQNHPTTHKKCSKCNESKPIQEFYRDNSAKYGLMSHCIKCHEKWAEEHETQIKQQRKEKYHKDYKGCPKLRQKAAENARKRRQNNIQERIKGNLRNRVWKTITKGYKSASTMELTGCSMEFLLNHLESQFESWMNFQNYGKPKYEGQRVWEVDHIIPCEFFDLEIPEQQRECFNWKNLRPLCAAENRNKIDKVEIDGKIVYARNLKKKNPTD